MYKKKPQKIPEIDPYKGITRIFPLYVANNYEFFELLSTPRIPIKNVDGYVLRVKKKISCMKAEFLL